MPNARSGCGSSLAQAWTAEVCVAILRKPDAGGVRIDVIFESREDAEMTWMQRDRESLVWRVEERFEGRYRPPDDMILFLQEAAVLAAKEYLKLDPLDEPPPCSDSGAGRPIAAFTGGPRGRCRGF